MQLGVTQQWQSAAELSTPPHEAANEQSATPASWQWSRGSGEWSATPRAATQAPQRERAAITGRTRALSPRGQLAQLNNILLSLDSCAEGTEQKPITTSQTGRYGVMAPEQTLRRRCSETQRPAPVAYQPLRRHRSQPGYDPSDPARPVRSPAPQKPVHRRHSASLHPHDGSQPIAVKLPRTAMHSLFIDSTGLERNEAPLRERAALADRTRALSPRSQLSQLHTHFASRDSDAEGMDRTLTTTQPQPGHLFPKQLLRRYRSETLLTVPDDYQPHSLRRNRSQPDNFPEKPARPMRSSTALLPEQPMRRQPSASLQRHGVPSFVMDDISLDPKDAASVQLARARQRKTTSDNFTAAHRHARQFLHASSTSDSNLNARLAEWCHEERTRSHSLGMLTPFAASKKPTSLTAVALDCPPGRSADGWWRACQQLPVAFFNSLWAALALATALLPGRTCGYVSARQATVDMADVACEFKAAQMDLHACKEEYLRCKSALVLAKKRFARAATPL